MPGCLLELEKNGEREGQTDRRPTQVKLGKENEHILNITNIACVERYHTSIYLAFSLRAFSTSFTSAGGAIIVLMFSRLVRP